MKFLKIVPLFMAGILFFQVQEMQVEARQPSLAESEGICIAQVKDYLNVRNQPNLEGEVLGKMYNNSVGTVIEELDGWYQIISGNVTGYIKSEYVITGEEAEILAKEITKPTATVRTETLRIREDASTETRILGLIGEGEELTVIEEKDGWVQVSVEEGNGWVSTEYVELRTDFTYAESKEEEEERLAKEKAAREEAQKKAAAAKKQQTAAAPGNNAGSVNGNAVVAFASQFVGNPYVYGGTSLTNGADCSGFVMRVYANFGVSLPHSSSAMRSVGYGVSLEDAQPGDIICYSGHVAIYCGNNTIVHASTRATGIKYTSPANYRNIICVRRIF